MLAFCLVVKMRAQTSLPRSIQTFSLFLGNIVEPDELEDVVNQVIECKTNRCLGLNTFRVETVGFIEIDNKEINQLEKKLAEVGISFGMDEYSTFGTLQLIVLTGFRNLAVSKTFLESRTRPNPDDMDPSKLAQEGSPNEPTVVGSFRYQSPPNSASRQVLLHIYIYPSTRRSPRNDQEATAYHGGGGEAAIVLDGV